MGARSTVKFDPHRLSGEALCQLWGVSAVTRRTWVSEGMPRNADESFDGPGCFRWRREKDQEERAPSAGGGGELDRLRAERMKRNITMADMTILEKKKETIPTTEHIAALTRRCSEWQRMVSQLPGRNAHHFVQVETVDKAREMLTQFCKEFADVWILTDEELEMQRRTQEAAK
jgi:hypothetical protein